MKLSILVTFYNQEKYVDFTLNNIFSMNINYDYEVLIGDDGSTDNTVGLLKIWKERYPNIINYFVMERDSTIKYDPIVRASRNRVNLLKNAKGEYIAFLDGDDFYCDKEKFNKQIYYLDNHSNCVASATNCFMYYSEENKKILNINQKNDKLIQAKNYWKFSYYHISTFLFRNIFLDNKIDFIEDFFDDNYITFVFLKYGDLYYFNIPTTCYRQSNESVWNSSNEYNQAVINYVDYEMELIYNQNYKKYSFKRHLNDFRTVNKYIDSNIEININVINRVKKFNLDNSIKEKCKKYTIRYFIYIIERKINKILGRI
ncbi:MAG: glycosyltransferase [Anaeroplasma sp.]|nr:glycosyltransferase [Anaeroplasma sp.]